MICWQLLIHLFQFDIILQSDQLSTQWWIYEQESQYESVVITGSGSGSQPPQPPQPHHPQFSKHLLAQFAHWSHTSHHLSTTLYVCQYIHINVVQTGQNSFQAKLDWIELIEIPIIIKSSNIYLFILLYFIK